MRKLLIMITLLAGVCAQAQTPREWRDSVSTLIEAIRQDPQSTDLRLKKAEANINLQQWEYAIAEYGDVLRLDDRNLAALYFRAYCHTQLRHYDMAKADWDEALRRHPANVEYAVSKVDVLLGLDRRREARETLDAVVLHGASRGALKEWYDKCK